MYDKINMYIYKVYFLKIYSDPDGSPDLLDETYGFAPGQVSFKNSFTWQFGGIPAEAYLAQRPGALHEKRQDSLLPLGDKAAK